jgi:DNA replication protein DnaD
MNYVQELSSFYDWLEFNTLTPSSINLWHALMHIQQKAGGAETFSVAESVLCIKTCLSDRTLRKARKELKEKGRIEYISRKGKAPTYRMIPFHEELPHKEKEEETSENISVPCSEVMQEEFISSEKFAEDRSALYRQQTDKRIQATWSDVVEAWRSVFGFEIKVNHMAILDTYMAEDRMTESLIIEGIDRVKGADRPVLNYLWKTLSNWANLGISTIKDLVQHEKARVKKLKPVSLPHGRDIPKGFHLDLTEGEEWA